MRRPWRRRPRARGPAAAAAGLAALGLLPEAAQGRPVQLPLVRRPRKGGARRLTPEAVDEAWLFGDLDTLMAYHVDVMVGTPGQVQSVIVDTGSSTTAFPCTACGANCGKHIDPPFDPSASSTFRWVRCGEQNCQRCEAESCAYGVSYVEGSSIRGAFFEDVLQLGEPPRDNRRGRVWLGCHTEETNLFRAQAPTGILGLGETARDVLEALVEGPLERAFFTLCMADRGGVMTLDDVNQTWTPLAEPMQWVSYETAYHVAVASVEIVHNGTAAAVFDQPAGDFTVDSGTTFSYFSEAQAQLLRSAVERACADGACGGAQLETARCWKATAAALEQFPSLRFRLGAGGDVTYVWPARGYLYEGRGGRWCYAFAGEPPLTLGASFMLHHLVAFDRDSRRIGFARAGCPEMLGRRDAGGEPTPSPSLRSYSVVDLREVEAALRESTGLSGVVRCRLSVWVLLAIWALQQPQFTRRRRAAAG